MEYTKHQYIGGKWVAGEGTKRQIINPANESLIVEVQEASRNKPRRLLKQRAKLLKPAAGLRMYSEG